MSELRVAFYGDDFTGSVDALLQFARQGWTGRLFVGLPDEQTLHDAAARVDVIGIAGIARSLQTDALEPELAPVFAALTALGPRIVQYKACSTADSSPAIGSIGRVIELGRAHVSAGVVPMVFAQPDFGRFTVFGHHFAAENGIVYRLDRQPTMSTHPSTSMTESDLAVHFSHQTDLSIGSIPFTAYESTDAVARALREATAAALVMDARDDHDLLTIGSALTELPSPVFAVGSGGLSHAIAIAAPGDGEPLSHTAPGRGPVLAVSGSRSPQTRRQADAAEAAGWLSLPLPLATVDRPALIATVSAALRAGRSVVLTSDDADATVAGDRPVLEVVSEAAAEVVGAAVRAEATSRVVVCGGDTSSRVVRLLGIESLSIAANPWANIVLLRAQSADRAIDGLQLLLKGGQVGDPGLFERIRALGD